MASDQSLAWPPTEAVFDRTLIMINETQEKRPLKRPTQISYEHIQATKSLQSSLLPCGEAMSLLHVAIQAFRQCKQPHIAPLNSAEEGTFVGSHVLSHGFYQFEHLGTCRAGQLLHSWRRTMFGLKMCHIHS